jgi:hypothetical protein
MQERKVVTKALAEQFRRARKKVKGQILDEFVEATEYTRSYAAWLLRNHGRRVEVRPGVVLEGQAGKRVRAPRPRRYGPPVVKALKQVWEILDYVNSKRLAAALPEVVPRLVAQRELKASKAVQRLLGQISPATIDRLLQDERNKHTLRGRHHTKPGTLLKHQVPVRTFADWEEARPGFFEMDLVGHDGGVGSGEFCFTLDMTDVATGWSEQRAVLGKAQTRVFDALHHLRGQIPFAVLGLDSDNGSEFINTQLVRYCHDEHLTFTRSRPYRKNDTCYVEQKNWSIVRRHAGYARYATEEACACLNELYAVLRDYVNFFMPSMKLKEKVRDGARVTRRYDKAQTPYRRVLASPQVSEAVKQKLRRRYAALNPAELKRRIDRLQRHLQTLAARSTASQAQTLATQAARTPAPNHPWRRAVTPRSA